VCPTPKSGPLAGKNRKKKKKDTILRVPEQPKGVRAEKKKGEEAGI